MTDDIPRDGEYSHDLDAYFDASNESWTCAQCLAVRGSVGCCKWVGGQRSTERAPERPVTAPDPWDDPASLPFAETRPEATRTPAKRKAPAKTKGGSGNQIPWTPKPGPFEIRGVDEDGRKYFFLEGGVRLYSDACGIADVYREERRHHVVVWWPTEQRPLYDSRKMASKWPWSEEVAAMEEA